MKTEIDIVQELMEFIKELESRIEKAKRAISELTGIVVAPKVPHPETEEKPTPPPVDGRIEYHTCDQCGMNYVKTGHRQRFCSKLCNNQFQRDLKKKSMPVLPKEKRIYQKRMNLPGL
jgi:hypothetical protein